MIEISDLAYSNDYFGDLRLATRLAEAAMRAQEKTILISDCDLKKERDNSVVIEADDMSLSYILNGIHDTNIIVKDKINHLLIRESKNIRVTLLHTCISGIDLLKTKDVEIIIPYMNYLEVSFSDNVKIQTHFDFNTKLHVQHCNSVYMNGSLLNLIPFDHVLLSLSSQVRIPFHAPDLMSVFNYF